MPGAPDPLYVLARRVLLDVLEALGTQRQAVVVVGAQAIYLHAGEVNLAVAEHTTDADLTLDPELLQASPLIEAAMESAGFTWRSPGAWVLRQVGSDAVDVDVDLMVPEAVGGAGSRGARLGVHGNQAARKVRGMEAALVDKREMAISAFDPSDPRVVSVAVAGPAALLVSKLHKLAERLGETKQGRLNDKDALDILRLLQATDTTELAATMRSLVASPVAGEVTREAVDILKSHFADSRSAGSQMAARAAGQLMSGDEVAASCSVLATDLVAALSAAP